MAELEQRKTAVDDFREETCCRVDEEATASSAIELTALQKKVEQSAGDHARRAAACDGAGKTLRDRCSRTSSCAATRNNRGDAVPRQFLQVLGRRAAQAVHRGQRPAGTGAGHRQQGQSADRPRSGQSRLAVPLRRRPGAARRATSACAASRRRIPNCSTTWRRRSWTTAGRSRNCTG